MRIFVSDKTNRMLWELAEPGETPDSVIRRLIAHWKATRGG